MPRALAVMAHPDDIEFTCAGTLILLRQAGWRIHTATLSPGDMGSSKLSPKQIAKVRRREAAASAGLIDADYTCLELRDLTIFCNAENKRLVTGLLRKVRPDVLFTLSPIDYMTDHEETARLTREAAFACSVPNWKAPLFGKSYPACEKMPVLYYADPVDHVDHFGRRFTPSHIVDITSVIDQKERMLACHASQREWLRVQHGEDEYLEWMRRSAAERARDFGRKSTRFAEGFTQHRGHGFPKDDILTQALGRRRVKTHRAK
jgi:LmbE family N-acetylglucosaminyl deacetylase